MGVRALATHWVTQVAVAVVRGNAACLEAITRPAADDLHAVWNTEETATPECWEPVCTRVG
eukprot:11647463-Prorocentrum_lima.AAC.1